MPLCNEFEKGAFRLQHTPKIHTHHSMYDTVVCVRLSWLEIPSVLFCVYCVYGLVQVYVAGKIDKFNYGHKPNDMILTASTEFHFDYPAPSPPASLAAISSAFCRCQCLC